MKRHILFLLFCGFVQKQLHAQYGSKPEPKNYITVGTGINAMTGIIGFTYDRNLGSIYVTRELEYLVFINGGLSPWGYKYGIGLGFGLFDHAAPKNFGGSLRVNYSHVTGRTGVTTNLQVEENGQQKKMIVEYNMHPSNVLSFALSKLIATQKKYHFAIELGYAFNLDTDYDWENNYTIVTPGVTLTNQSKKILHHIQPGGWSIALGIGIHI